MGRKKKRAAKPRSAAKAGGKPRRTGPCGLAIHTPLPTVPALFAGARLRPIGPDAEGRERFWTSSRNLHRGCLGLLINAAGEKRLFPFKDRRHAYLPAVAPAAPQTLWLAGDLGRLVHLGLESGHVRTVETGLPPGPVRGDLPLAAGAGRMLLYGATAAGPALTATLDAADGRVLVAREPPVPARRLLGAAPVGDGEEWLLLVADPGLHLLHWSADEDALVRAVSLAAEAPPPHACRPLEALVRDGTGRAFLPGYGWYDPAGRRLDAAGPRPAAEAFWFGSHDGVAYGLGGFEAGGAVLHRWSWEAETTERCGCLADVDRAAAVTGAGEVVAISRAGAFTRRPGRGGRRLSRALGIDAVQAPGGLVRLGESELLGTVRHSARFWIQDLQTGRLTRRGRAAGPGSWLCQVRRLGRCVFFTSAPEGELLAFDPSQPACFPENPRPVAGPPGGGLPHALTDDGRRLYYLCDSLDGGPSRLVRYDGKTGEALVASPVEGQRLSDLHYEKRGHSLLAATGDPEDLTRGAPDAGWRLLRLDAETLALRETLCEEPGAAGFIDGPLRKQEYLWHGLGFFGGDRPAARRVVVDLSAPPPRDRAELAEFPADCTRLEYAGRRGWFVLLRRGLPELWNFRRGTCARVLADDGPYGFMRVDGKSVYLARETEIVVLRDCLKDI